MLIEANLRGRKWGWAYSTNPVQTPTGLVIEIPNCPVYTGSLKAVHAAITEDRTYRSLGGACHSDRWFYDGKLIIGHIWFYQDNPDSEDWQEVERGHWGITHDLRGFDPADFKFMGNTLEIEVEDE